MAYARFEPDLVVLDRLLPGLDGLEVCGGSRPPGRSRS